MKFKLKSSREKHAELSFIDLPIVKTAALLLLMAKIEMGRTADDSAAQG